MVMKYQIKLKRDWGRFGFWNPATRRNEKLGWVVVLGGCNCIPGAMWFRTIADAMLAVEVHMITGDTMAFHDKYREMKKGRSNGDQSVAIP